MIIRSHSAPIRPGGLSPMQERLLRSEKFVRLVSAPTGSGKSHAFMRATIDEGAHVLFIAPTKRLLQNLIGDAREQARERLRERGWEGVRADAWAEERIVEWSGNQAADEGRSLAASRARQFLNGGAHPDGYVVFAIPEVVVAMISGIRVAGASAINPFLYPRRFDHIVFDEFHTIDDRSFGLACLFSLLAIKERRGKVSLLSATPVDVTGILERMDVRRDEVEKIAEEIVDGHAPAHRPIHGNVAVSVRKRRIPDSIESSIDAVRATIAAGRAVVVIYDSLKRLKLDRPEIRGILEEAGLPSARILALNSIDDSRRRPGESRRGRRYADPRDYDVLLCTSSVEVGVTFRSTLMFMEPGFGVASFAQRVGRVSRGVDDGQVVVSLPQEASARYAWTRRVAGVVEGHDELTAQEFYAQILRDARRRLEPTDREAEADPAADGAALSFHRRASWRGAFWAALFIVAVRRTKMKVQTEANARLRDISPNVVRFIEAKVGEILSVDIVNDCLPAKSQPHKRWVEALLTSALSYRDIGATIEVVDPDGARHTASESFLRRATDVLDRHIASDEDGERVIHLISRPLDEEIRRDSGKRDDQRMTLYVPSPIGEGGFSLSIREREKGTEQLNVRLVEEWRDRFARLVPKSDDGARDSRCGKTKVMGAATALVERLGRPPLDEDYEDSGESALFA